MPEAKFCNECGTRLVGGADSSGPALDTAPIEKAQPEATPRREEERRLVTLLFADLVGFTALADRLDAEEVRELTAITLGRIAREITSFGGTIDKFIGDAVLAIFGAPTAHEDDAERAVGAGLAIMKAMAELNETLTAPDGRLALRVGINSGQVVVGRRELGGHSEYTAIGDSVNVAARLQASAEPGSILVGESTYRAANRAYAFIPIPPLVLRGKPEPVAAYLALGPLDSGSAAREALPAAYSSPRVGREQELMSLRYCLEELQRGRGQIAFVVGEAGLGKTRLVAEARREFAGRAVSWSEARAVSYGQHLTYGMFSDTIRELFEPSMQDGRPLTAESFQEYLASLDAGNAYPFLAPSLGLPLSEEDVTSLERLAPLELQARLITAIRTLLRALAQRSPMVLVLEDIHWADPSSLVLLEGLLDLCDEVPLFFCFLMRPERESAAWRLKERAAREFPHRYSEIALEPLNDEESRELVQNLARGAVSLTQIQEQILAMADGNPLFIEEVVRDIMERRGQERRAEAAEAAEAGPAVALLHVPDSLQSAIVARLDRLRESVRRLVQTASVIGRTFRYPVLARLLFDHSTIDEDLREAQRLELIRDVSTYPEREYTFKHVLVQEAVYQTLLVKRRKELHGAVARAVEELYEGRLEPHWDALAHHHAEAENWSSAIQYSILEGDRAAAVYANREALAHYQHAWWALRHDPAVLDNRGVVDLLAKMGDAQSVVGLSDEAVESYQAALDRLAEDGSATRALFGGLRLKLARVAMLRQDPVAIETYLQSAFLELPEQSPEMSLAWSVQSWLHQWRSEYEPAAEAADRALALAREYDDVMLLNEAYGVLAQPALATLPGRSYRQVTSEWLELARDRNDRHSLMTALSATVLDRFWISGRADDETLEQARQAVELAQLLGAEAAEQGARNALAACLLLYGRWAEARSELRAARALERGAGLANDFGEYLFGLLFTSQGQLERGKEVLAEALESLGFPHSRIWLNQAMAWNRLEAGEYDDARLALERASEAAERLRCRACTAYFSGVAAESWAALGNEQRARHYIEAARDVGAALDRLPTLIAADRAEASLFAAEGRWQDAARRLRAALKMCRGMGQPFETARTSLQLGGVLGKLGRSEDRQRAQGMVASAIELFESVGAAEAARRARQLAGELSSSAARVHVHR